MKNPCLNGNFLGEKAVLSWKNIFKRHHQSVFEQHMQTTKSLFKNAKEKEWGKENVSIF